MISSKGTPCRIQLSKLCGRTPVQWTQAHSKPEKSGGLLSAIREGKPRNAIQCVQSQPHVMLLNVLHRTRNGGGTAGKAQVAVCARLRSLDFLFHDAASWCIGTASLTDIRFGWLTRLKRFPAGLSSLLLPPASSSSSLACRAMYCGPVDLHSAPPNSRFTISEAGDWGNWDKMSEKGGAGQLGGNGEMGKWGVVQKPGRTPFDENTTRLPGQRKTPVTPKLPNAF